MSIGWQPQRPRQAAWPAQPDRLGLAGKLSHRSSSGRACQYSFISCHCLVRKLCQLTSPVRLPRSLNTPQGEGVCRAWGRTLDQAQALAASQIGKSSKSSEVAKLLIFGLCTLVFGIPRKSHNIIRMCLEICLKSVGSSSVLNTCLFYKSNSISSMKLFDLCLTSCISFAIKDLKAPLVASYSSHK